jgi:hypothetical protein
MTDIEGKRKIAKSFMGKKILRNIVDREGCFPFDGGQEWCRGKFELPEPFKTVDVA